ncbi:hypothetical protein M433DRAFT_141456 [Acidomyces richmondensis BFW]|jgi:hypothetical protein|nr:MAG: hypothetical protein FE78DRAFT_75818 [Acidomyces sp. 'richmondensis']KYG47996.1 hypothetical protein M433DRAFT_141456 [Acidomyces richmondensis BFW]
MDLICDCSWGKIDHMCKISQHIGQRVMIRLHEDENFHFENARAIGTNPYDGCGLGEIFANIPKIRPGNFGDS